MENLVCACGSKNEMTVPAEETKDANSLHRETDPWISSIFLFTVSGNILCLSVYSLFPAFFLFFTSQ